MSDRCEQIQQQAIQAADEDFQIYRQAYQNRWNELLNHFETEKELLIRQYRLQGMKLGASAFEAKIQGFYDAYRAMESGDFSQLQIQNPKT